MDAELLPDGSVLVPKRAEGPSGEIGDAMVILNPGDEGYGLWVSYLRRRASSSASDSNSEK